MEDRNFFSDVDKNFDTDDGYQKKGNAPEDFFAEEDPHHKSFPWVGIITGVVIGMLAAFIATKFLTDESSEKDQKIPVISNKDYEFRRSPENMPKPIEDARVYEGMRDFGGAPMRPRQGMTKEERLRQQMDKPMEEKVVGSIEVKEAPSPQAEPKAKPEPKPTAKPKPKPKPKPTPKENLNKVVDSITGSGSQTASDLKGWHVQLLSGKKKKAVENAWNNIYQNHKSVLSGHKHAVIKVNIDGTIYYRLRVVGFDSVREANELCSKLKAKKQDCIVFEYK
jgi:hypothetical protein